VLNFWGKILDRFLITKKPKKNTNEPLFNLKKIYFGINQRDPNIFVWNYATYNGVVHQW
jgi:hypothetical protein